LRESRQGLVLFDGLCVLCDRSMRWLLDADRRGVLSFAPLQGETAKGILARHPEAGGSLSTVVYVRDPGGPTERVFLRSDAAIAILDDLGGRYRVLAWSRLVPRALRNALYDWVAARRYRWFGRLDSCRLPDEGMEDRFLP
jgi:predicted DCC family thiol-disulfide oxidoreductase YuxK